MSRDFLTLACYNAVSTGQLGLLKALQKTGRAPHVDKQGNTPLHVAAKSGQAQVSQVSRTNLSVAGGFDLYVMFCL